MRALFDYYNNVNDEFLTQLILAVTTSAILRVLAVCDKGYEWKSSKPKSPPRSGWIVVLTNEFIRPCFLIIFISLPQASATRIQLVYITELKLHVFKKEGSLSELFLSCFLTGWVNTDQNKHFNTSFMLPLCSRDPGAVFN